MGTKLFSLANCKMLIVFLGIVEGNNSFECSHYVLKNDFKNIDIRICGNQLFYYEKDYDMGPYIDTCEVKFSGRNIVVIKSATNRFCYKKIFFSGDGKGIMLVFKQSAAKSKKLFVPEKPDSLKSE